MIAVVRVVLFVGGPGVLPSHPRCHQHYRGGRHGKSCSREGRGILRHSSPFARNSEQCLPHFLRISVVVD